MELEEAGPRLPTMAIRHFWITDPSQSAAFLHKLFTCEDAFGYLATISSRYRNSLQH
jgi:hypothetical protein